MYRWKVGSAGVLCIVGEFDRKLKIPSTRAMQEVRVYAGKTFGKSDYVDSDFATKPKGLMTTVEFLRRQRILKGIIIPESKGGYQAVAVFGSYLPAFGREAVNVACASGKDVFVVGVRNSTLERYGRWFPCPLENAVDETEEAYREGERRNIMLPG